MAINPGGRLDPRDIIGRSREIERYWSILSRQSLVLGGERRLGKTHLVHKMRDEGRDGFVTFYRDLEGVHNVVELVKAVYDGVSSHLSTMKKLKGKAIAAWDALAPQRYGALQLPTAGANWKMLLGTAIRDVLDTIAGDSRVVLCWDEVPYMLYNLGPEVAIEVLDELRQHRQIHGARLRFLFTGSIGLHLVLRALRVAGNANAPLNDVQIESLPPMRIDEAREVAVRALQELREPPRDVDEVAALVVDEVGGYPYFIHHVVDRLSLLDFRPDAGHVLEAVEALLRADDDPAHFSYFAHRIETHYVKEEASLALAILDAVAGEDRPLWLDEITNLARHRLPEAPQAPIRGLCQLLRQDHYLSLDGAMTGGCYEFRWPLLKRWWKVSRL